MARRVDERRWLVRSLLVGLVSANGGSSTRSWSWRTNGDAPDSRWNPSARQEVGIFNGLHEWVFGQRNGLIDPNQIP
jgi:hypothetical protein